MEMTMSSRRTSIGFSMALALGGLAAAAGVGLARPAPLPRDDANDEITPRLVSAVERGLACLAQRQQRDGSWIGDIGFKLNQEYCVQEQRVPHVGVTALCGMAFLAGGHLPDRGEYGEVLDRAITFLIKQQNDNGFITAHQSRMYDHAFATLFLAEIFGQTARGDVRAALQRAVDLIVNSQNYHGSWRYEPFALESDMSITVCQLMALRAARNVGIRVPKETIKRAVDYVKKSQVQQDDRQWGPLHMEDEGYYALDKGAFRYQYQEDDASRSSFALTAAGITSLYHAAEYDTRSLGDSLRFLEQRMDSVSRSQYRGHYFYWYGHYYAVQAMFITGEIESQSGVHNYWRRYWNRISGELLETGTPFSQASDGSWPNEVGPGSTFATAIALIVLQVPYRYLPILQR
jgi:hypothetical protein